jgi:hypothetical protein
MEGPDKMNLSERVNSRQEINMSEIFDFTDTVGIRGSVKCFIEEDGVKTLHHEKSNLIVNGARKALAHLVAEATATYKISQFQLGIAGHSGTDILTPVSPTINDVALNSSAFSKAITVFEYLPSGAETSVKFTVVIDKAEANGSGVVAYTEAGLFCADNVTMFARETFPAIVKNANRRVSFEWSILF